jgi:F-type H+-transporting ATPase subunit c
MINKKNLVVLGASLLPVLARAEEVAVQVGATNSAKSSAFWAAGLCMGLAAAIVGFSQSRAAVAALEGIGRNPAAQKGLFVPLILSLALMESLALLAFVVSNGLVGK